MSTTTPEPRDGGTKPIRIAAAEATKPTVQMNVSAGAV